MANSTYFNFVNRILQRAGQKQVPDTTTFDSGTLTKTWAQAKGLGDEVNRTLGIEMPAEFLKRAASISTTGGGVAGVPLLSDNNTGWALACPLEQVIPRTMFITTAGFGRELWPKPRNQFIREYPEGRTVQGCPISFTPLPETGSGAADFLQFDPPPDRIYTVQYDYYLVPPVLTLAADVIVWPVRFEPLAWAFAGKYLEIMLGEGKAPEFDKYFEPLFSLVRQQVLGLAQIPPTCEMGFEIRSPVQRGQRSAWAP